MPRKPLLQQFKRNILTTGTDPRNQSLEVGIFLLNSQSAVSEQFYECLFSFLPERLIHFRRIDAPKPDYGEICNHKGISIDHPV